MLEGKVIMVTGGSSGIGRATAEALVRRGAQVALVSRSPFAIDELVGARVDAQACMHIAADVTIGADVERCIATIVRRFGRIDGAFNNASPGGGVGKVLADFTDEEFDGAVAANLRSVFLCMRAQIRAMLSQDPGGGTILNTASVNGLGAAPLGSLYSAAKAGVIALSKAAALEYAGHGIRCNALVPGAVRTPMLESVLRDAGAGTPGGAATVEREYVGRIPLGRLGRAEELAEAAVFLLSDASSYMTGASMIVDGGITSFAR